ncbi:methyltransferase domain-containing protein [bacterium]|nr:MAG: methyltransferase domain-containing protein [bacterium]
MDKNSIEAALWNEAKKGFGNERITLGAYWSYVLNNTPRRLLFTLSHYKFAAKLLGCGKKVLEVGCNEGVGTLLLAEMAENVVGIDIDADAIKQASVNFASDKIQFINQDILNNEIGIFDGVVSLDVIEHIYPQNEDAFLTAICQNLSPFGICVIGTPNEEAERFSNEISRKAHVNVYSWQRLKEVMDKYFHQVFMFSANDETIHTGFYPMAQYLIAVGVAKT